MRHLLSVVFIATIYSVPVSCLMILLQFDGSLRKPSDAGAPTAMLGQMAACACSIRGMNNNSVYPLLLGGKGLFATSTMTSGEVEYEGLLFGLLSLQRYLAEQVDITKSRSWTFCVQGDCKNVLNQMSGRAVPRKLEYLFRRAKNAVHSIEEQFSLTESTCTFIFEHIPRSSNLLCDRISALIVFEQQKKALKDARSEIWKLEDENHYKEARGVEGILDRWFQWGKSLIPITTRPELYQRIVSRAKAMQDFSGLLIVSSMYEKDIRILQKSVSRRKPSDSTERCCVAPFEAEKADAILYQVSALHALCQVKEARRIEQKNRILLAMYPRNIMEMELQSPESLSTDEVDWPSQVLLWKKEAFESQIWLVNCEYISCR